MPARPEGAFDRRSSRRLNIRQSLFISFAGGSDYAISQNVSTGGIFFYTSKKIPLGSHIEVLFVVPEDSVMPPVSVRMTGKVVRLQEGTPDGVSGVAVCFTDVQFVSQA